MPYIENYSKGIEAFNKCMENNPFFEQFIIVFIL